MTQTIDRTTTLAFKQIDEALASFQTAGMSCNDTETVSEAIWLATSVICRLTQSDSPYRSAAETIAKQASSFVTKWNDRSTGAEKLKGILKALRREYENGFLSTFSELMRAETFADFLEQAQHLLSQGYEDPAAVMCGGVLEQHIKKLCLKHSISLFKTKQNGEEKPAGLDELNGELAKANVYNKAYQKTITSFLAIRNHAAHGQWSEYSKEQVNIMLTGVNDFIGAYPA